jgi:hypothetical protein
MAKIEDILLDEIRLNRADIAELRKEVAALDKGIFSNKMKLSIFISGITIFFNIIIIVVAEKLKTFFT